MYLVLVCMDLLQEDHLYVAILSLLALEFYCLLRFFVVVYNIFECILANVNIWLSSN